MGVRLAGDGSRGGGESQVEGAALEVESGAPLAWGPLASLPMAAGASSGGARLHPVSTLLAAAPWALLSIPLW